MGVVCWLEVEVLRLRFGCVHGVVLHRLQVHILGQPVGLLLRVHWLLLAAELDVGTIVLVLRLGTHVDSSVDVDGRELLPFLISYSCITRVFSGRPSPPGV